MQQTALKFMRIALFIVALIITILAGMIFNY